MSLRLGDDADFARVREFLDSCAYTGANAAERIGFERLDQIGRYELMDHPKRDRNLKIRDSLGALVKLFLCGSILDAKEAAEGIPAAVLASLEALGLVERRDQGWVSPVLLYPSHGVYLASDRFMNPDGSAPETAADFVFLTLQRTGMDFMGCLPDSPCDTFLDLGTGNGIAALWAARTCARHAWGIDITDRAVHFAEFNRRLNGIPNVTILKGDLYEPVAGKRFDRIAIHPPYSMSVDDYIYAYGGDDGEWLTRRAIEGAPAHLAPGGIFACWTTATNRRNAPLEQRVRAMAGAAAAELDVAVLVEEIQETDAYAMAALAAAGRPLRELQQWRERFAGMEVESLVYGGIFLRSHTGSGQKPVTLRRMRSPKTPRAAAEWLLLWENAAAQADHWDALLRNARPVAAPAAELQVRHRMRDGSLAPMEYAFRTIYPFDTTLTCGAWLAYLFSRCDGTRTSEQLFGEVAPRLPENPGREYFAAGLAALISGGFLEIEGFRLPAQP